MPRSDIQYRTKTATVSATQGETTGALQPLAEVQASILQTQAKVQAQCTAFQELTVHVSALNKTIEKVLSRVSYNTKFTQTRFLSTVQPAKSATKGKCKSCISKRTASCTHCFQCGQEWHRALGCLLKGKPVGNMRGSLGRHHQWPHQSQNPPWCLAARRKDPSQ